MVSEMEHSVVAHQHPGAVVGSVVGQQLLSVAAIGAERERVLVLNARAGAGYLAGFLNLVKAPAAGSQLLLLRRGRGGAGPVVAFTAAAEGGRGQGQGRARNGKRKVNIGKRRGSEWIR